MPRIEKENGREWTEFEGMCVVRTLASIAADISGHPIRVSDQELTLRREHQLQLTLAYYQNKDQVKSQALLANDDKERISDLIDMLIQKHTPIGQVLRGCEIRKVKGNTYNAKRYIKHGYHVGMFFNSGLGKHMFHLVLDEQGNLYNNSDSLKPDMIAKNGHEGFLDEHIWDKPPAKNTWNLLLIRPRAVLYARIFAPPQIRNDEAPDQVFE